MTYEELAEYIMIKFNSEQLKMNVTVYDQADDEFYPVTHTGISSEMTNNVLDNNHPYLGIK